MRADVGIEAAVDRVITEMQDDYEIKEFLIAHRAEVRGMLLTEYDEAEQMELFKEEGREEAMRDDAKIVAERFGITEEEALSMLEAGRKEKQMEARPANRG